MASTTTENRKCTYEDYLKTPDDERYELIGGELLMTPSPVPRHQRISRKIEFMLEKYVTEKTWERSFLPLAMSIESPYLKGFKIELKGIF